MKADHHGKDDDGSWVAPAISTGSIIEFDDGKHTGRSMLGVVQGVEKKAKAGYRYVAIDAKNKVHTIASRSVHADFSPARTKEPDAAPADILKGFIEVASTDVTELGVDPEMLELAWEVCADAEGASFSPASIVQLVDEKACQSSVDKYKAFRLISSDLGKIFFKSLSHNQFKAKASKAVEASKEAWCKAVEDAADHAGGRPSPAEFCLV